MKPVHLFILIGFNFLWAASLSIYKALAAHLAYGGIVTLRFGVAAVGLLALWPLLPGRAPRGWDLGRTAVMGVVVFTCGHRLQVFGNQLGTAGNSSVLMALEPLVTSIGAAMFLHEHITARRWVGFGLGLLGVVLLNGGWRAEFNGAGLFASCVFVASFICETVYSVVGKPLLGRASLWKVLTLSLAAGTLGNLAWDGGQTLAAARLLPGRAWWQVFYLSLFCTALGYAVWLAVIEQTDVNLTAMTIFAQPIAGVLIAALWLGEPLHWGQLWGSLAIVAGLVVGLWRVRSIDPPGTSAA